MRKLIYLLLLLPFITKGQTWQIQNVGVKTTINSNGSFAVDSVLRIPIRDTVKPSWWNTSRSYDGALQVGLDGKVYYYYGGVFNAIGSGGGGGTGTVTSISQGYGILNTPNPITTNGAIRVDTSVIPTRNLLQTRYMAYVDTAAMLVPYLRKGDTISLSNRINTKLNITDTANMRVRLAAGSNITLTGTYPNITIAASGGGGDTSTPFVPLTFANPIRTTKDKVSVTATSYTTIYIDSSSNGDVGMVDMQNPSLNTIRLDGVLEYSMPRSSNDLLTWVNVGGTIKWDVINYAATSGVYQAVAPIGDTLTFALRGAGFTGYTGNYATTGSSGIATSTEFLSGEGYIQFDAPTTGVFGIGLDSVYSLESWLTGTTNNYNYAIYFASTNVYSLKLGDDLSAAGVTAIGSGGIMRFGRNATDQMYLSLSTDGGTTYSVIYTFAGTSTAPMYVKLSGFSGSATITNLRRFF